MRLQIGRYCLVLVLALSSMSERHAGKVAAAQGGLPSPREAVLLLAVRYRMEIDSTIIYPQGSCAHVHGFMLACEPCPLPRPMIESACTQHFAHPELCYLLMSMQR